MLAGITIEDILLVTSLLLFLGVLASKASNHLAFPHSSFSSPLVRWPVRKDQRDSVR
jgi:hypothetical protein